MSVTDTFSIAQRFFIDNKHLLPGCLPVTQVNEYRHNKTRLMQVTIEETDFI